MATSVYCSTGVETFTTFTKGVKWSPDGTCLLAADDDNTLKLFDLPPAPASDAAVAQGWKPSLQCVEGETVYDYSWYPYMDSSNPVTCCFVASSRDHPLHLWDAFTGTLRASYRAYDHLDEIVAAYAVSFSADGSQLVAGYNRCLRIFDLSVPGKSLQTWATSASRKARDGQRGLISALAPSVDGSNLIAAGSYHGSIVLYDARSGRPAMDLTGNVSLANAPVGGVTQLKFAPDGRPLLFSGSRRGRNAEASHVVCWDVRVNGGDVCAAYPRQCTTHQRIGFDIDPTGRYLATGTDAPEALVYDLSTGALAASLGSQGDAVNGCAFHPRGLPLLALATGTRHIVPPSGSHDDSSSSSDSSDSDSNGGSDSDALSASGVAATPASGSSKRKRAIASEKEDKEKEITVAKGPQFHLRVLNVPFLAVEEPIVHEEGAAETAEGAPAPATNFETVAAAEVIEDASIEAVETVMDPELVAVEATAEAVVTEEVGTSAHSDVGVKKARLFASLEEKEDENIVAPDTNADQSNTDGGSQNMTSGVHHERDSAAAAINGATEPHNEADAELDIASMRVTDLKCELAMRGESTIGRKQELAERLVAAIAKSQLNRPEKTSETGGGGTVSEGNSSNSNSGRNSTNGSSSSASEPQASGALVGEPVSPSSDLFSPIALPDGRQVHVSSLAGGGLRLEEAGASVVVKFTAAQWELTRASLPHVHVTRGNSDGPIAGGSRSRKTNSRFLI